MRPLFLALIAIVVLSTNAVAQKCREQTGKAKIACIESTPAGAARVERCREEGWKMGLGPGRRGGLPSYVHA